MSTPVAHRVRKSRAAMRAAGMRPIQIWVPDTRSPVFKAEAERQSRLLNEADAHDPDLDRFMEAAWADLAAELDEREGRK